MTYIARLLREAGATPLCFCPDRREQRASDPKPGKGRSQNNTPLDGRYYFNICKRDILA